MADQNDSKTVKAGSKTYFFDLKETKEGQPYLTITESRFMGEGQDRERVSIVVFLITPKTFCRRPRRWLGNFDYEWISDGALTSRSIFR